MAEEKQDNPPTAPQSRPDRKLKEAAADTPSARQLSFRVSNTSSETAKMFSRRRSLRPSDDPDLIWPE
jgi:hypothetical protein